MNLIDSIYFTGFLIAFIITFILFYLAAAGYDNWLEDQESRCKGCGNFKSEEQTRHGNTIRYKCRSCGYIREENINK